MTLLHLGGNTGLVTDRLVALTLHTGGIGEEHMGSDDTETVFVAWTLVDCGAAPRLIDVQHRYVKPKNTDNIRWDWMKQHSIYEHHLDAAQPIDAVLKELEDSVGSDFKLVTDGVLPVRQVLFPELTKKSINVPSFLDNFYDIHTQFKLIDDDHKNDAKMQQNEPENNEALEDMLKYFKISVNEAPGFNKIMTECEQLGQLVVQLLLADRTKGLNKVFRSEMETVKRNLEQGICDKDEKVGEETVVRARGLPWQASDHDIAKFFIGLNIARGGVALCLSSSTGRRNGEALVRFESSQHRDMALRRHRHFLGQRYIEIYRASSEEFLAIATGSNSEAMEFLSRNAEVIIRMRGLPYDCVNKQILEFFAKTAGPNGGETEAVQVMDGEKGILFVNKADGKATGDAFVLFRTEKDGETALAKHKHTIGCRYIELFRSTTAEVQQVINNRFECHPLSEANTNKGTQHQPLLPQNYQLAPSQNPLLNGLRQPMQVVISGAKRDCIRLRGLPYECQVQNILDFLGESAKNIVFQGVHTVYNAQGHPTGEAFIQMNSEVAASKAASGSHNRFMKMGNKQRYIEVFQCSADDMNLVLTGPAPIISPISSPTTGLSLPQAPQTPRLANAAARLMLSPSSGTNVPLTLARMPMMAGIVPPALLQSSQPQTLIYWPYPSPPMSPPSLGQYYNSALLSAHHSNLLLQQQQQQLATAQLAAAISQQSLAASAVDAPVTVLVRGLSPSVSKAEILLFFSTFPHLTAECIQLQRVSQDGGNSAADALVTFPNRLEAERAVLEKNHTSMNQFPSRPIELFLCTP